jgi:hypothetical protein
MDITTDVAWYDFLDAFRPNVQLREAGQNSTRHTVELEKIDLASGEWRMGQKLQQPRLDNG